MACRLSISASVRRMASTTEGGNSKEEFTGARTLPAGHLVRSYSSSRPIAVAGARTTSEALEDTAEGFVPPHQLIAQSLCHNPMQVRVCCWCGRDQSFFCSN